MPCGCRSNSVFGDHYAPRFGQSRVEHFKAMDNLDKILEQKVDLMKTFQFYEEVGEQSKQEGQAARRGAAGFRRAGDAIRRADRSMTMVAGKGSALEATVTEAACRAQPRVLPFGIPSSQPLNFWRSIFGFQTP